MNDIISLLVALVYSDGCEIDIEREEAKINVERD